MNCLNEYTYQEFVTFIEEKLGLDYWDIWDSDITNRISRAKLHERFQLLQNIANEANIYPTELEVLSWLDTLNILYRILAEIPDSIKNELKIIQEYMIPFSKKRVDYILLYRNKILILEFSFTNDEEQDYKAKLKQVLGYKELMLDLLPNNIDIGTYVFLIRPEIEPTKTYHSKLNKYTQQQDKVNSENIFSIQQYIMLFFTKEQELAYNELNKLHQQETRTIDNLIQNNKNKKRLENKKYNDEIEDSELVQLINHYKQISEKYPDYIVIIKDNEIENLHYFFNKAAEILEQETYYMRIDETMMFNEKILYRKILCGSHYFIEKLTTKYTVAIGTCLDDIEIHEMIKDK